MLIVLHPSADIVVCLDVCFTQKRIKTKGKGGDRDPPNCHPSSIFMSEADVKVVEDFVESCWTSCPRCDQNGNAGGDRYEAGMRVPTSVLNGCNNSFVAADEKREKASSHFFADTGLMALLTALCSGITLMAIQTYPKECDGGGSV